MMCDSFVINPPFKDLFGNYADVIVEMQPIGVQLVRRNNTTFCKEQNHGIQEPYGVLALQAVDSEGVYAEVVVTRCFAATLAAAFAKYANPPDTTE